MTDSDSRPGYFRVDHCPVCRAKRAGERRAGERCASCGISFSDERVAELGRTLQRADGLRQALLAERAHTAGGPVPNAPVTHRRVPGPPLEIQPGHTPPPTPTRLPSHTRPPAPGRTPAHAGSFSVGWILLGVGALCLAVAAGIFVAVSWDTLSWLARAAVLLTVAAAFAAAAEVSRRRQLRASAEALSGIAGVIWFVTLLAGVRLLPPSDWAPVLVGGATMLVGVVADRWLARNRDRLWAVDVLVAVGVLVTAVGLIVLARPHETWAVLGLGAGAIAVHRLWRGPRLVLSRLTMLTIGGLGAIGVALMALSPALDRGDLTQLWKVFAVAVLAGILAAVGRDTLVRRLAAGVGGGLLALAAIVAVRQLPLARETWLYVALTAPAVLLWSHFARPDGRRPMPDHPRPRRSLTPLIPRRRHASAPSGPTVPPGPLRPRVLLKDAIAGWLVPLTMVAAIVCIIAASVIVVAPGSITEPLWITSTAGFLALGLLVAVVRSRNQALSMSLGDAGLVLGAWVVSFIRLVDQNWLSLGVLALAMVTALAVAWFRAPGRRFAPLTGAAWLALLVVVTGLSGAQRDLESTSALTPAAFAIVGLAGFAWGIVATSHRAPGQIVGCAVTPLAVLTLAGPLQSVGVTPGTAEAIVLIVVAGAAAITVGTAAWWLTGSERLLVEVAGLTWGAVAVFLAMSADPPTMATCLVLGGVGLIAASFAPGRGLLVWAGAGVLTAGLWVQLGHLDVTVVEAYTLPPAAGLLVIGGLLLHRDLGRGSWRMLGPGLLFGLLPSALMAYADPVSPRALSVGLAALVLILVGLSLRLGAPFVLGALVLSVLAVVELWPYAAVVPRWLLLAVAGVILVVVGVRWEARLADLRRMGAYVRHLG